MIMAGIQVYGIQAKACSKIRRARPLGCSGLLSCGIGSFSGFAWRFKLNCGSGEGGDGGGLSIMAGLLA
jgi:hypothetical protein